MKLFKITILLVLSLCFLTACANLSLLTPISAVAQPTYNPERKLHEPDEFKTDTPAPNFYVKRSCWKSPFNPHEVLHHWVKLEASQINEQVAVAVVGNPKVDWSNYRKQKVNDREAMNVEIPAGEIASAVVFVFVKTQVGTIELISYGYNDDLGVKMMYAMNQKSRCYERIDVPRQQQSCLSNATKPTIEVLNINL